MASITIPFPEGTRTVTLRGKRISIGRLPDNVIQIRDRTISAYHAELIEDGDHYRLHDKGSTNGVIVQGQRVSDFHLHGDCQISFGGLVCEFSAASQPEAVNELDAVPTRSEMLTILQANGDLRSEAEALRAQVAAMTKARETSVGAGQTVPLEQHDQLAAEAAALRETLQEKQTQIDRLTSMLAISNREKEALQKGYEDARAALEKARSEQTSTPAGPAPAPAQTPAQAAPKSPAAPATPNVPGTPAAPGSPQPGATGARPSPPRMPGSPTSPVAAKPLPKPPGSLGSGSPSRRPASGAQPAPAKTNGAAAALVAAGTGPKGTQKLIE